VRADPPFIGIELDISDSGREGCSVSMLTITAQPIHWQETVQVRRCFLDRHVAAICWQFIGIIPHKAVEVVHDARAWLVMPLLLPCGFAALLF
jgi:hypothetical protein